jgi:Sec-independent protein translocase protein TatA
MAQKGGTVKRFILIVIFLAVFLAAFVLLGGGNLLKSAGTWIGGLGSKADSMKGKLEEGATSVEKKAAKVKEAVTSAEKKAEKVKEAVTSGEKK